MVNVKKKLRVLVVEDSADDARLVTLALQKAGCVVAATRVDTAAQMRAALEHETWDVVISDYAMPEFSGPDALNLLKESGCDVPFILISGTIGEEVAVEAMRTGANDYVMKDSLARLGPAVARELREAASRRQKRALEAQLKEEEARFRAMIELSHEAVSVLDRTGRILYASPSTLRVMGFRPEECVGRSVFDFVYSEDVNVAKADLGELLGFSGDSTSREYRCVRRDGVMRWLEVTATNLLHVAHVHGLIVNYRDVTERRQAQDQLRYQATLLDSVNDAIVAADAEFRITAWNAAAESLFGWKDSEVLGQDGVTLLRTEWPQRDADAMRREIAAAGHWRGEAIQTRRDGSKVPVEISTYVLRDPAGGITSYVSAIRDIIERKRAEAEIETLARFPEENPHPVLRIGRDGKILYANRSAEPLLQVWGCRRGHSVPPDWASRIEHSIAGGKLDETEIACGGRLFSLVLTPIPVGGYLNIYGRDVTDLRRVESGLQLFRTLVDRSTDAIQVVDPATARFVDLSESACRQLGYSRTELLGLTVLEVTPSFDRARFDSVTDRLRQVGTTMFETTQRRRDGTLIPVEVSLSLVQLDREYAVAILRDITERKRIEQHLGLLNTALLAAPNAVVLTDEHGIISWVNPAFTQLTGYALAEAVGQHTRLLKSGRQSAEFYAALWRTIASGQTWHGEFINRRKDGSLYVEESTIAPVRNADGAIRHFVAIKQDISRRKEMEESLRKSEERFRNLAENTSDWIWETDEQHRYTYASPRVRDLLGYEPVALVGRSPFDLMAPTEAARVQAEIGGLMAARQPFSCIANTNLHQDGHAVILESSAVPVFDAAGSWRGYRGIDRDITERTRIARELRREQDLLANLMSSVPDQIYFKDRQSRFTRINRSMADRHGLEPTEVLGKTDFDLFTDEHARQAFNDEQRLMASGEALVGLEEKETWTDGHITWVSTTKVPLHDQDGRVCGVVGISRDITRQKENEHRLRDQAELIDKANEAIVVGDLENRITLWNRGAERLFGWTATEMLGKPVSEVFTLGGVAADAGAQAAVAATGDWRGEIHGHNRKGEPLEIETSVTLLRDESGHPTGKLSISTDVTEKKKLAEQYLRAQRLESIGMLAAGIAHDLNNVLAPVLMAATMLRKNAADGHEQALLETIEKSAGRGAGLVRQILGFAHGIGGEPRLVQPKHLLRDIGDMIEATFPKAIRLELDVPSDLWPITANPTQIHQVLLNLCVNARDAMPEGGTLTLRAENVLLDDAAARSVPSASAGAWVLLTVRDTGTGIAPAVIDRIWDPFFTTKGADRGTGLGLSTVRGIVATHRGCLTLESSVGRGTTFRVYLPADAETASSQRAITPTLPLASGHNELILVVDDESSIREVAKAILRKFNYQVITANDGQEALAIFKARVSEIPLVITDLDMPNLGGAGLASMVRTSRSGLKVLAMTGIEQKGGVQPDICQFADGLLMKPFTAEELIQKIQALLPAHSSPPRPGPGGAGLA